jgi:hypothetical protein
VDLEITLEVMVNHSKTFKLKYKRVAGNYLKKDFAVELNASILISFQELIMAKDNQSKSTRSKVLMLN